MAVKWLYHVCEHGAGADGEEAQFAPDTPEREGEEKGSARPQVKIGSKRKKS